MLNTLSFDLAVPTVLLCVHTRKRPGLMDKAYAAVLTQFQTQALDFLNTYRALLPTLLDSERNYCMCR